MGITRIPSSQVRDGDGVRRPDLNTTTVGEAVIAKVVAGTGITITETGADSGTGDVTINADAEAQTFTDTVALDPNTDITAAEAETLTDNSNADALHKHSLLVEPDDVNNSRVEVAANGFVGVGDFTGKNIDRELHIEGVLRVDREANSSSILFTRTSAPNVVEKAYGFYLDSSGPNDGEFSIRDLATTAGGAGTSRLTVQNDGDIQHNAYPSTRDDGEVDKNRVAYYTANGTLQVGSLRTTQFTQRSGRFEIDTDDEWASWSDPNFGPSLQDWDLDLGNGATPAVDWDGIGLVFPAGAILKRIFVKLRANNNDVDTIQTFTRMHDVDLLANNPIDSNAEIGAVDITAGNISVDLDAGLASSNDMQAFEIPLGDYVVQNDGADLHLFMRSAPGTTGGNYQLRCTLFVEWQLPEGV